MFITRSLSSRLIKDGRSIGGLGYARVGEGGGLGAIVRQNTCGQAGMKVADN